MRTYVHGTHMHRFKVLTANGCTLVICDEQFTSRACGSSGQLHHKLVYSKTFRCRRGYTADRDANAARSILLHFMISNNTTSSPQTTTVTAANLATTTTTTIITTEPRRGQASRTLKGPGPQSLASPT